MSPNARDVEGGTTSPKSQGSPAITLAELITLGVQMAIGGQKQMAASGQVPMAADTCVDNHSVCHMSEHDQGGP